MKAHSIKTDNADVYNKVRLRKFATKDLKEINVLDLFAGENVLWSKIKTNYYFGVEKVSGKGKNLNADNLKVIPSLDLSVFNVIDIDSYGIPYNQLELIFNNSTLKSGTIIIYTCITNSMSSLNKSCIKNNNLDSLYKKCKVLFNQKAINYFYDFLYNNGIKSVFRYEDKTSFEKHYGFFIYNIDK